MSDSRFKIVFDGALLPGVESTTAKLNLAELFKSDVEAIEKLFTGRPVALKRDLSRPDAETYLSALKNAGVDARIEAEQPVAFSLAETHETSSSASDFSHASASPYAPPRAAVGDDLPEYSSLNVFTIHGRIGRLRYLAWMLVLSVAMLVASGIIATASFAVATASPTLGIILGSLLGFALFIVLTVVSVQIGVQRLHDLGWSGWLWFLNLVPVVGGLFPIAMAVIPGNPGANRYGAPQPPNSTAVKVLAGLWLVVIAVVFVGALAGGLSAVTQEYESTMSSSYEIDEPAENVEADDAAQPALPPVDYEKE